MFDYYNKRLMASSRPYGKFLFNDSEIILTSLYTILGRSNEISPSRCLLDFLNKAQIKETQITFIKINDSQTMSKNALLIVVDAETSNVDVYNISKNLVLVDNQITARFEKATLKNESFIMLSKTSFFFVYPKEMLFQHARDTTEYKDSNSNDEYYKRFSHSNKFLNKKRAFKYRKHRNLLEGFHLKTQRKVNATRSYEHANENVREKSEVNLSSLKNYITKKLNDQFIIVIEKVKLIGNTKVNAPTFVSNSSVLNNLIFSSNTSTSTGNKKVAFETHKSASLNTLNSENCQKQTTLPSQRELLINFEISKVQRPQSISNGFSKYSQ